MKKIFLLILLSGGVIFFTYDYLGTTIRALQNNNEILISQNTALEGQLTEISTRLDSMGTLIGRGPEFDISYLTGLLKTSVYKIAVGSLHKKEYIPSEVEEGEEDEDESDIISSEVPVLSWVLGTAFCIFRNDLVITNAHVLGDSAVFAVLTDKEGNHFPVARVVAYDTLLDYALLDVPGLSGLPLELADYDPVENIRVMTMGNPLSLDFTPSDGWVTALRMDGMVLQMNTPVTHGSSGGPVVDKNGSVMGLVFGGMGGAGMINFAVNIHYIYNDIIRKINPGSNSNSDSLHSISYRSVYEVAGQSGHRPVSVSQVENNMYHQLPLKNLEYSR